MDYGRYNYGIHGGYFMVYKPLITWGGHPVIVYPLYKNYTVAIKWINYHKPLG